MKTSDNLDLISEALNKAQGEFKVALKDAENPFFKSSYADFQSIVDAARPSLVKHGLSFVQMTRVDERSPMVLVTRIIHKSGQWIEGEYPVRPAKDDPQSLGAAVTYSKRYALQAALGIVASHEDDDAESEMDRQKPDALASKVQISGILKSFAGVGVGETELVKYLGLKSKDEITLGQLHNLKEIGTDIKNKKSKAADYFGAEKKA